MFKTSSNSFVLRDTEIEIDLPKQTITLIATGEQESFEINDYKKGNMLNGFDDIEFDLAVATMAGRKAAYSFL